MTTKMRKITCLLAALMTVVSFASCGNSDSSSDGSSSSSASQNSESTADGEDQQEGGTLQTPDYMNEADVFPICKETTTYRIAVVENTNIEDYETNYETQWLKEKGNMEFEFEILPSADLSSKVQLQLASYELPDAYFGLARGGCQTFTTSNALKYSEESGDGQIIALNDYIEAWGTNTKALFEKYASDGLEEMMTSADGNIYYMPGYGPSYINRHANVLWLNMGWMDKLDLEIPTTTDEFEQVLLAFKNNDPNGNGKADEIPLSGTSSNDGYNIIHYILSAFTVNNTQNFRLYYDENNVVHFAATEDAWREGLKYINRLYSQGLIDPALFTQDLAGLKQVATDAGDICGGFSALGLGLVTAGAGTEVNDRYDYCPPLTGPDGTCYSVVSIPTAQSNGTITSECEKPEALFRLMDYMLSEECSTLSRYGIEGENYEIAPEGTLSLYGEQASIIVTNGIFAIPQNTMWQNFLPFVNDIHNNGAGYPEGADVASEEKNAKAVPSYMETEPSNIIPLSNYTLEEADIVNECSAYIKDMVNEGIAKFTVGEWDINDDADWQTYLNELENAGLSDFLACAQAAFDRTL